MSDNSDPVSSLLMWLLACIVSLTAAYVSQGWVRMAQRAPSPWRDWRKLFVAAAVLGTGMTATAQLLTAAANLPFAVGYRPLQAAGLWGGAMLGCLPIAALAASSRRWWLLAFSGVLLAALTVALELAWVSAAGTRPGVVWRWELVGAVAAGLVLGIGAAQWLAHTDSRQDSHRELAWQLAGAALLAFALMAGHEGLLLVSNIAAQSGSIYQKVMPAGVLSLISAVLVPMVLGMMALDLTLRARDGARSHRSGTAKFAGTQRRKRRHRLKRFD